jgi:hypothetical protein
MPDPAARLRAAATLLQERAAHYARYADYSTPRFDSQLDSWSYDLFDRNALRASKDWVLLMSPDKAEPLASWLLAEAREYDKTGICFSEALAFADSVLTDPGGESRG